MSKPKIPPTPYGYSLWKQYSTKDVHVRYFPYNFKDIQQKHIKDQEDSSTDGIREAQKFVYDTFKKELSVTFTGHIQSGVVDKLVEMMQESIQDVPTDDGSPRFHTNLVSRLFQSPGDENERYRLVGDVLVTNGSGPVFAVETATRHSLPAIKEKVKKWFLLPTVTAVLVVHLNEANGYWKPTSRPQEDDVFLINSWAWLNYIVDINEGEIDLFDCSKPVTYGGHVWFGSLTCALELYERDFSVKSSQCAMSKRYEFTVPNKMFELEVTDKRNNFEERFSALWEEAIDGESLNRFRPFRFDWKRLAKCVAKTRLQLAYERYKVWFTKYSKTSTPSSCLGKRERDNTNSQEIFL